MGFATPYETWVSPMGRDGRTFVPMVCFWFAVQMAAQYIVLPRIPGWRRFRRADQEELIVRAVSVVNGFLMMMSAVVFLMNLYQFYDMQLPQDLYTEVHVPFFPFFRVAITSYFAWDLITCFLYKWTWAWKIHAIASLLGSYTLMFPFSDVYAGFYTGCFEVSNAFMHFSVSYRLIADYNKETNKSLADTLNARAALCEYLFAFLFTAIRVVAGSFVTCTWMAVAVGNVVHDVTQRHTHGFTAKCHSVAAYAIAIVAIGAIQLLQYVWFLEIVKRAVGTLSGGGDGAAAAEGEGGPSGKTAAASSQARQSSSKRRARKED